MKYFNLFLMAAIIFLISCEKNATNPDQESTESNFKSVNVKDNGAQYFNFATNEAVSEKPAVWDISFEVVVRTAEVGFNSCIFFTVSADPVVKAGKDVVIARLDAASLSDVSEIPAEDQFMTDDTTESALVGKSWLDPANNYEVRPDVYVFKTCGGNYGLVQFRRFDFDMTNFQISNIVFDYKYNDDGSMDFNSSKLDSFHTGNAYEATRYFSYTDTSLSSPYGSWEMRFEGSMVWLGPDIMVHKLENTDINDVTTAPADNYIGDDLLSYITADWYTTDEAHKVIPNDYVYVVKTAAGKYAAFKIKSYYDDKGNSGSFSIDWKYMQ